MAVDQGDEVLTAREVSRLLRVSVEIVKDLLARGQLDGFHRGRITRITRASVGRLLGRSNGAPADKATAA